MLRAPADAALVRPSRRVRGRTRVPGDKSISHRYAMLAALADGTSRIGGYSPGADCAATLACLGVLGPTIRPAGPAAYEIVGRGVRGLRRAGPSARLREFRDDHAADERHPRGASAPRHADRRQLADQTADAPCHRSAHADGRRNRIRQRPAAAHDLRREISAGPRSRPKCRARRSRAPSSLPDCRPEGRTTVQEAAATRDHTERALDGLRRAGRYRRVDRRDRGWTAFDGAGCHRARATCRAPPSGLRWPARRPADASRSTGVGLNPTRIGILEIVRRAGAAVSVDIQSESSGEPTGTIRVEHAELRSFEIAPGEVPVCHR